MKISKITTKIMNHDLFEDYVIKSNAGVHQKSQYLQVCIESWDGILAYGEAATTSLWSGETAAVAQSLIENEIKPLMIGSTFEHPKECLELMDKQIYGMPFTKSAIDTALWDLYGKKLKKPSACLFQDRNVIEKKFATRISIGCYDEKKTLRLAEEFYERSIRTFKLKVGVQGVDDVLRLKAVRSSLGSDVKLTVDANGAYSSVEKALEAIEKMEPYDLSLVEQPVPREKISMMAKVKKHTSIPILADEAIFNMAQLEEALDLDAFDILSLYPGKNGGLSHAIQMAKLAEKYDKPCVIGSNLETELGEAAMLALASGMKAIDTEHYASDFLSTFYYKKSVLETPLKFNHGKIFLPEGNGLGVSPVRD